MCEAKPGPRCSSDTCEQVQVATAAYAQAHPEGPAVNPVAAAVAVPQPQGLAARHLRPGDVTTSGETIVHCYRGVRTPAGKVSVRLAGTDRKTGEPYVRDAVWNASTQVYVTRP